MPARGMNRLILLMSVLMGMVMPTGFAHACTIDTFLDGLNRGASAQFEPIAIASLSTPSDPITFKLYSNLSMAGDEATKTVLAMTDPDGHTYQLGVFDGCATIAPVQYHGRPAIALQRVDQANGRREFIYFDHQAVCYDRQGVRPSCGQYALLTRSRVCGRLTVSRVIKG